MPKPDSSHPVLRAAARWRDRCLLDEGSVLTEKRLWTSENVTQLVTHFAENLDEGEGGFLARLERQLDPAPPGAKQLAAEMLWVMYLFAMPGSMQPGTKRLQIRRVWEWSGEPLPDADDQLHRALEEGFGHPGVAFHTHRWREFLFFVRVMEAWTVLTRSKRRTLLGDPWKLAEWLGDHDKTRKRQLRHILLFLLFPDKFEPIATATHKHAIVRAFRKRNKSGDDSDEVDYTDLIAVDREVLAVRERLQRDEGVASDFGFYDAPYRGVWQSPSDSVPVDLPDGQGELLPIPEADEHWYRDRFGEQRVWLIALGRGAEYWNESREQGIISIGWDTGDLRQYAARDEVHQVLRDRYGGNPTNDSLACYQFAHEMQVGDHVLVKQGRLRLFGHGVIESHYQYDEGRPGHRHTRRVAWRKTGSWQLLPQHRMGTKTLTEVSTSKPWLQFAFRLIDRSAGGQIPQPQQVAEPPYTRDDALHDLFLPPAEFDQIIDALTRKKNIVLEGPPGVGKTFIARRLAYTVIRHKAPERVRMIQFHQSYAYEDFIQGYRPGDDGFERRDGVFLEFCREAAANPDQRYVFIIDEVNRGNLSRIFGELLMLIEATSAVGSTPYR